MTEVARSAVRLAVVLSHPIQYYAPLYRELAKASGVELEVFYCTRWGLGAEVDPGFGVPVKWDVPLLEGYAHEFLPLPKAPRALGFRDVDNPGVARALARFDPDIVEVHGYAHRTNWRALAWVRRHGKILLYAADSNAAARRSPWKRAAKKVVVGYFYDRVDAALYTSENNRLYHRQYGVPEDRLFPCPIPIDRAQLLASVGDRDAARRAVRERHGIPAEAFLVNLTAKYVEIKRHFDLVAVLGEARRRGLPVWGIFVGEGPERTAIVERCRAEGVENVTLTGFVNQSAIGEYYAASDVVTLPSSREALGLVVVEGLSFGLPAVISDQVGCAGEGDAARPGVNAMVFPVGDRRRYFECIERLCVDRALYGRMARASEAIAAEFDARAVASRLVGVLGELRGLGPRSSEGRRGRAATRTRA